MKKIVLIFIILFFSKYLYAQGPEFKWTVQDTLFQGTFITLAAVDLWQTYTFLYNDKHLNLHEKNPILGKHPSKKKLFIYFGSGTILHTGIAYLLPKPYRTIWQLVFIGSETYGIYHNYKLGVRIHF